MHVIAALDAVTYRKIKKIPYHNISAILLITWKLQRASQYSTIRKSYKYITIVLQLSVFKMAPIQTFVFIDFGTVFGNLESVTEVSLLSAPRNLILNPASPEPKDKLTLDFKTNGFNLDSYAAINNFINQQNKPVCLVAHSGNSCDFPILKRELEQLNVSLSDDVLCADSLYAFYDILEHPDEYEGSALREIFYEGDDDPIASYELWEIYDREVTSPPVKPHPPENDNIMAFRISRKLGKRFLSWTDQIQREFADVTSEELGTD